MSSTIDMVNKPSIHKKTRYTNTIMNSSNTNTNIYTANQNLINPTFDASVVDVFSKLTVSTENPINITKSNVFADCDQKCSYSFSYSQTLLVSKNNGTQITFNLEESNTPSVTYNNNKYNVSSFSLFAPSLHIWNGDNTQAEIVIEHIPIFGGKHLYVCIPIVQSGEIGSTASTLITEIITEISKNAPGNGDSTNLSITNFSLENVVPLAPFYNYYGENSLFTGDFIVFDKTVNIPITSKTLKLLTSMIQPSYNIMFGGNLFYNSLGPNTRETDIYISCKPTGSSNEPAKKDSQSSSKSSTKNQSINDITEFFNSQGFMIFMICIGFIVFIFLLNYLFNTFTGSSMPNLKMFSNSNKISTAKGT